jgi:hypothetical protein
MSGRQKGLFVNSRDICSSVNRLSIKARAQNGKVYDTKPVIGTGCGKKKGKKK